MKRPLRFSGWILAISALAVCATASAQDAPQRLRPDEFNAVALIYNSELSALGERALYPICIDTLVGVPVRPLLQYLRKYGFQVSDPSICEPGIGRGGHYHPKDWPHGLRISIEKLPPNAEGLLSIRAAAGDLTIRPGVHFGTLLRSGTYHFKRSETQDWEIAGYTKDYDWKDEKECSHCDCAHSSPESR